MPSATIYKINDKDYLLHANIKAISGFSLAAEPFIRITKDSINTFSIAQAIKDVLSNDDDKKIQDPKNWSEFHKSFLKNMGLKSSKELNKQTTLCIVFANINNNIIFTPTKHVDPPDQGFSHKSKEEAVTVAFAASNNEIIQALNIAFSRCE